MQQMTYKDELDENEYELRPEPFNKGDRCGKGCAFRFCGSKACVAAPPCNGPDIKGNHVWVQTVWGSYARQSSIFGR